jgi:hypothetical protein
LSPTTTTTYTLTVTNVLNAVATKSIELVVANGWSQITTGSMNCAHTKPAIIKMANGNVLVTGNQYTLSKCAEVFNPSTGTFTQTSDMTLARKNPYLFNLADGRVLIIGGVQEKYPPSTTVNSIQPEIYNPDNGTFTLLTTYHNGYSNQLWMPYVTQAIQMSDGRIFILSGNTGTAVLDPITGAVYPSASTLYSRSSAALSLAPWVRRVVLTITFVKAGTWPEYQRFLTAHSPTSVIHQHRQQHSLTVASCSQGEGAPVQTNSLQSTFLTLQLCSS